MVLNNYMKACRLESMISFSGNTQSTGQQSVVCSNTAGYFTISGTGGWVDVGFGTTAVSVTDNILADSNSYGGAHAGALTYVSCAFVATNPYLKCYTTVYRNDGSDDVTVTELGLVGKNGNTNNQNYSILLARTVLETPVVIPAGSTAAFTYGIKV